MKVKGFEGCKTTLSFMRYVNEKNDVEMDEYIRQRIDPEDYAKYQEMTEGGESELCQITDNQYRYLWQQTSSLGYRTREPKKLDVMPEPPALLKELVDAHLNELGYSEEELAQLYRCR